MTSDVNRLGRILARLPEEEAEWLLSRVSLRASVRSQLEYRDVAIRDAAAMLDGGNSRRAVDLERELRRYLAAGWNADVRSGAPAPDAPPLRHKLFEIASANRARSLGWRQIMRVIQGARTPTLS